MPHQLFETQEEYRSRLRLTEKQREYRKHHDRSGEIIKRRIKRGKDREALREIK